MNEINKSRKCKQWLQSCDMKCVRQDIETKRTTTIASVLPVKLNFPTISKVKVKVRVNYQKDFWHKKQVGKHHSCCRSCGFVFTFSMIVILDLLCKKGLVLQRMAHEVASYSQVSIKLDLLRIGAVPKAKVWDDIRSVDLLDSLHFDGVFLHVAQAGPTYWTLSVWA